MKQHDPPTDIWISDAGRLSNDHAIEPTRCKYLLQIPTANTYRVMRTGAVLFGGAGTTAPVADLGILRDDR